MQTPRKRQLDAYLRAANYLAGAQIYLQDNALLERKLDAYDIKPRLLGHWGSAPGINFVYAHLNELVRRRDADVMFVMGPGHAAAALQANLFIEGTLGRYYPKATRTKAGASYLIKQFSWPYGFPSHANPGTPGVIIEGGELGYALATAYGAAADNPGLIVAAVIGDGEAETGATATSWHLGKLLDPAKSGAVLPILHLNGYKISGPTIFGRMKDSELRELFRGYGYEPLFVKGGGPGDRNGASHDQMERALETAYRKIRDLQRQARAGKRQTPPRWPMIVLRTPKGWTGIKALDGKPVEGTFRSHQVIAPEAKTNPEHLAALEEWLRSYRFDELFHPTRGFSTAVRSVLPVPRKQLGRSRYVMGPYRPLRLPPITRYFQPARRGKEAPGNMELVGEYLKEVFARNPRRFRLFSPDETYSNKLDAVFTQTKRAWQLPITANDADLSPDGRVMEMLSEHALQGMLQGYVLTGRHGAFASYEAFIQIVSSMADQYAKFLKVMRTVSWRPPLPSLNYLLTASSWRQEHNGFSHQNPGFVDDMLQRHGDFITAYFPVDGNSTLVAIDACLRSNDQINILTAGKKDDLNWLSLAEARRAMRDGIMTWQFVSQSKPDLVFSAVGEYLTTESLAAMEIIRNEVPAARLRFVSITALSDFGIGPASGVLPKGAFERHFTADKPVIFNFHGYPETLKSMLFDYERRAPRFSVHGYSEAGSTTTPFDMQMRNETDRYHLAIEGFDRLADQKVITKRKASALRRKYQTQLRAEKRYVLAHGIDPVEIRDWRWKGKAK